MDGHLAALADELAQLVDVYLAVSADALANLAAQGVPAAALTRTQGELGLLRAARAEDLTALIKPPADADRTRVQLWPERTRP